MQRSRRASNEEYNEYFKQYRKTPQWKEYHRKNMNEWRKKHPGSKDRIRLKVWHAIQAGTLVKKPCEVCGEVKVEGHHSDYRSPLKVIWLCRKHHRERDVQEGRRKN